MEETKKPLGEIVVPVLMVGALWGIFEASAGYLLHLLPIRIGFLVWYPTAVFFLMTAYRITGRQPAVLGVAALASAIKLLNLMLPGRIDRVINPAVSILLEGLAVFAVIHAAGRLNRAKNAPGMLLASLCMNTVWRVLYLGYLAFLVPDWMREVSVLKSGGDLLRFLVIDHLCSSLIVFGGMLLGGWMERRGTEPPLIHYKLNGLARVLVPAALLALNITLQAVL